MLVEVAGPPRDRGRQYGEAVREQIRRSSEFYREAYVGRSGLSWERTLELAPRWNAVIEAYAGPDILEEVRGIAEGANRPVEELLWLNARADLADGDPFGDTGPEEGCTAFALTDEGSSDGHVYSGQNWDWRCDTAETVVLLRIVQPPRPTIVMQVEAGQVGRQGANSAGIGLNANGLGGTKGRFSAPVGVPSPYIRRRVLDAASMREALDAVFSPRQAFSSNLLLAHRDGFAIDIETTPGPHGWLYPVHGVLVHTNHFVAGFPPQVADSYRPTSTDSLYRLERTQRNLRRCRTAGDGEDVRAGIEAALADHFGYPDSVCAHADPHRGAPARNQTIASSIVDLTSGEYFVTLDSPCERAYTCLPWNLYA